MIYLLSNDNDIKTTLKELYEDIVPVKDLENIHCKDDDILIIDLVFFNEEKIKPYDLSIMVITDIPTYEQGVRLLQKGVKAYGNRYMLKANLSLAINSVKAGQIWLPPEILLQIISAAPVSDKKTEDANWNLSTREKEVAKLVCNGMSNIEISESLFISVRTVKAHLTSIFSKTGFRDRLELAVKIKPFL
jgi:DNA-binding NarL/FixJ family response regulator